MFPLSRSQSAGGLSDVLLMAAFGPGGPAGDRGSTENLTSEKAIDITGRHDCCMNKKTHNVLQFNH